MYELYSFQKLFRLSKEGFLFILNKTEINFKKSTRCSRISPTQKLLATLRFLAHGSYQACVGQDYLVAMGQSTVSKVLKETLSILEDVLCPLLIHLEMTAAEQLQSKNYFFSRTKIPGVIGAIDGTHVNIIRPAKVEHIFFNRKGNHSMNVMVICDNNMLIRSVNARSGGASHDSAVWSVSPERKFLEERWKNGDKNSWLLGDSGYPIEPWVITPYRQASEGSPEALFNHQHSKARNIIERTFGLLKGRFRCLLSSHELHYTPAKTAKIVNVCCALHNVCKKFTALELYVIEEVVNNKINTNNMEQENSLSQIARARRTRDDIKNSLIT